MQDIKAIDDLDSKHKEKQANEEEGDANDHRHGEFCRMSKRQVPQQMVQQNPTFQTYPLGVVFSSGEK